nr:GAF domain-containing protein [Cryptosporangium arvum]
MTAEATEIAHADSALLLLPRERPRLRADGAGHRPPLPARRDDRRRARHTQRARYPLAAGSRPLSPEETPNPFDGPAVLVPPVAGGHLLGLIAVVRGPGGKPFGDAGVRMVQAFAGQAALAVGSGRPVDRPSGLRGEALTNVARLHWTVPFDA